MRQFVFGLFVAACLALAIERSHEAYKWKQIADERGWKAEQAIEKATRCDDYLFKPVVTVNGQPLNRADLQDIFLSKALK